MSQSIQHIEPTNSPAHMVNELAEIVEDYILETRELVEQLGHDLLELESKPNDKELHKKVFRAVHTIKGTSSFLGFEQMAEITHCLEDVLNKLRKDELRLTSEKMDVILEAYDQVKALLTLIEEKKGETIDLSYVENKLRSMAKNNKNDSALQFSPEPLSVENSGETTDGMKKESSLPAARSLVADSFIRVEVNRLNGLMDLVGELVIARNRLAQITPMIDSRHGEIKEQIAETSSTIDFITSELQTAVMQTRMVSIDKVFNKLPRLVRDLSKELSKEIELTISGEATELDKSIIDELNDPLLHILRNAADHGLESSAERQAAGKPVKGQITITAAREGNHIVITVRDDGRGIDVEKLKQSAIEKGILTESRAGEMTKRELVNIIFEAGFSTAQKITNLSGRGVGLDVVRFNIQKMKGIVEVESELGAGTTFILKIPLTLAIIEGMLVKAQNEIFSIPLSSVLEVIRVQEHDIHSVNGKNVLRHRDSVLPLANLSEVMKFSQTEQLSERMYIVVVAFADKRLGIIVDEMLGQKELVIKSLGAYLRDVPGIAGSTILGDGKVVMILDVGQFMKLFAERT